MAIKLLGVPGEKLLQGERIRLRRILCWSLGGVIAIALMYLGSKIWFWLFVLFDFAVGYMFIFILQDRWYDHVAPHILYALVFTPFCRNVRWNWPATPLRPTLEDDA